MTASRHHGFTLIELMITIAIASILLAVAIPSMRNLIIETKLTSQVNQFIAALNLTRSEAIKRGSSVKMCRSVAAESSANTCVTSASGDYDSSDWGSGWVVMAGSEVLLRQGALPALVYAAAKPISLKSITYTPAGTPIGNMAGARVIFSYDGDFERTVCISRAGRIRVIKDVITCPA